MWKAIVFYVHELIEEAFNHAGPILLILIVPVLIMLLIANGTRPDDKYVWVGKAVWMVPLGMLFLLFLWVFMILAGWAPQASLFNKAHYDPTGDQIREQRRRRKLGIKDPDPVRVVGDAVPEWKIGKKVGAALKVLKFLDTEEPELNHRRLPRWVSATVENVKQAVEKQKINELQKLLTPAHFNTLKPEIDRRIERGEQQIYGEIEMGTVIILHVECRGHGRPSKVIAIVNLQSRDYIRHKKTKKVIQGAANELVVARELWAFQWNGERWLADGILSLETIDDLVAKQHVIPLDRLADFHESNSAAVNSLVIGAM